MHGDLAAILQVLHQQPETVLSERSKETLKKALETGVVTSWNIGIICSSLRCTFCGKVIGDGWFNISRALWKDQYIQCGECMESTPGDLPDEEEFIKIQDQFDRELKEAEKIAYPKGYYKRAHWEELLKYRGVPVIPAQVK